jgi:hypothetical protein
MANLKSRILLKLKKAYQTLEEWGKAAAYAIHR